MTVSKQCINYQGGLFECMFRKSKKARRVRLTVYCDGRVVATMPDRFSLKLAQEFVSEKSSWVARKLREFEEKNTSLLFHRDYHEYLTYKEKTKEIVCRKILQYNQFYGYQFNRICIRNQKTRWGSCSSDRNLNFNYKIFFLPERYQDYVIVHELCHLQEMNHSRRFWDLVRKTIPEARQLAREIRKM